MVGDRFLTILQGPPLEKFGPKNGQFSTFYRPVLISNQVKWFFHSSERFQDRKIGLETVSVFSQKFRPFWVMLAETFLSWASDLGFWSFSKGPPLEKCQPDVHKFACAHEQKMIRFRISDLYLGVNWVLKANFLVRNGQNWGKWARWIRIRPSFEQPTILECFWLRFFETKFLAKIGLYLTPESSVAPTMGKSGFSRSTCPSSAHFLH